MAYDNSANPRYSPVMLQNAMAYERRFVEMGGLLAAGVDPRPPRKLHPRGFLGHYWSLTAGPMSLT